jgi:hypothetical protein
VGNNDNATRRRLREFSDKCGLLSRSNKNSLVFLVADNSNLEAVLRGAQQLLALREVARRLAAATNFPALNGRT